MNNKEKLSAYNSLKAPQHLEKDLALLKEKDPENHLLKNTFRSGDKFANEVLYVLLDHTSREEIVKNRRETSRNPLLEFELIINAIKEYFACFTKESNEIEKEHAAANISGLLREIPNDIKKYIPGEIEGFSFDLISEWKLKYATQGSARLTALLHKTPTSEKRMEIMNQITDLIKDLPTEAQEPIIKLAESICVEKDKEVEVSQTLVSNNDDLEEKVKEHEEMIFDQQDTIEDQQDTIELQEEENKKLEAENKLMKTDLSKLHYNEKVSILHVLNLDEGLADKKQDTITPVLQKKQDELLGAAGVQKKS